MPKPELLRQEGAAVDKIAAEVKEALELAEEVCRRAIKSNRVPADSKHMKVLTPLPPLPPLPDDLKDIE